MLELRVYTPEMQRDIERFYEKCFAGLGWAYEPHGRLLFETDLNYAAENNYAKICADTRRDRGASQHLMRSHGFREVPRYNENTFAELFFELILC